MNGITSKLATLWMVITTMMILPTISRTFIIAPIVMDHIKDGRIWVGWKHEK
jgi:hypothetical protein